MLILEKKYFPLSTDFKKKINSSFRKLELKLKLNKSSGLIYLDKKWNYKKISPKYNWIKYSEPEEHLKKIKKNINKILSQNRKKIFLKILCCSFKDISLSNFFSNNSRVSVIGGNKQNGIEICQDIITKKKIKQKYDLVLARHILEHAFDYNKFLKSLKNISKLNTLFYFEVPDVQKLIVNKDYNLLWEDHINYFTFNTFQELLNENGFTILYKKKIIQPFEDLICVIAKNSFKKKKQVLKNKTKLAQLKKQCKVFKKNFGINKIKIKKFFLKNKNKKIFIFGAGHLTNTFIHLNEIKNYIDFIVDDHEKKRDLFFPGTSIKIINSSDFKEMEGKKVLIIGANPLNENKIIKRFSMTNSKFYSIFTNSKKYLLKNV